MIDCSHANSGKQARRQIDVAHGIAGDEWRIVGVMLESHLNEGRQELKPGVPLAPGVSITDACLGEDDTLPLLRELAGAVPGKFARGPVALQYGPGVQGATGGPIRWRKVQVRPL